MLPTPTLTAGKICVVSAGKTSVVPAARTSVVSVDRRSAVPRHPLGIADTVLEPPKIERSYREGFDFLCQGMDFGRV